MSRPRIPTELLAMMARGVSVIVASRDATLRPSMMRAMGSHVEKQGRRITVFVSRAQSPQLLQDLAAGAPVAAVFSEPATHLCVQVKASRVAMRDAVPDDEPLLARYLASMEREVQRVGFPPHLTRAMLACRVPDLVAVEFEPEQAFDQTPGPRAGKPLMDDTP